MVPGWITPALPLTLKFLEQWSLPDYATGNVDRIKAMIALQMLVALCFLIMGATGIGRKLVECVPMSIKAGIVLGAGITAGINVFQARMPAAPWTVAIACLLSYLFLFNPSFERKAGPRTSGGWFATRASSRRSSSRSSSRPSCCVKSRCPRSSGDLPRSASAS